MTNNPFTTTQPPVYRTHNQILENIIGLFSTILSNRNAFDWQVIQNNQPTIQAIQNNTVYVDCVSKKRLGVQGRKTIVDDSGNWWNGDVWYEEWLIQVSAFQQRIPSTEDSIGLYTAQDIISLLQASINGSFTSDMKNYFFAQFKEVEAPMWDGKFTPHHWAQFIRSTEIKEIVYETDSGLKEKYPTFDFTLVIEQGLQSALPALDDVEITTHPV